MARILSDETSLTRRKKRLQSESAYLHRLVAIEAIVAGVCLLVGAVLYVLKDSPALLWIGGAMGLLALGHWIKVRQNQQDSQSLGVGIEGEAEVTRRLAEYLDQRHYLFNDLLIKPFSQRTLVTHLLTALRDERPFVRRQKYVGPLPRPALLNYLQQQLGQAAKSGQKARLRDLISQQEGEDAFLI